MFRVYLDNDPDNEYDVEDFISRCADILEETEIAQLHDLLPGETIIIGGPGVMSVTRVALDKHRS